MKNFVFMSIGFILLIFGLIGVVLPVMPTTPFVIGAAICFSNGSPRLYNMLRSNKYFGEFIENYKNKTGVERKIKVRAIVFLWCGLTISMLIFRNLFTSQILLVLGIIVTFHIVKLKEKESD